MGIDRAAIKGNAKLAIRASKPHPALVALIYLIIVYILEFLSLRISGQYEEFMRILEAIAEGRDTYMPVFVDNYFIVSIINLALTFMTTIIGFGFSVYMLNVSRGRPAPIGNLFDGFGMFFKVIWLNFLTGLFIMLWSMLFVIPGIVAAYRYRQAVYVLIDDPDMSALDCIRASKEMMRGRKGELFVLDLSFIGWSLLSIIPFVNLWVLPYTNVTYANYYNAIRILPHQTQFNYGGNRYGSDRYDDGYYGGGSGGPGTDYQPQPDEERGRGRGPGPKNGHGPENDGGNKQSDEKPPWEL